MKTITTRETARKLKVNPHQPKAAQSQSPTHKKLLKKIEMIHKQPSCKNDLSLKENLLVREPQEEEIVEDFRVEIERRFKRASANQEYKFPLREVSQDRNTDGSAISSLEDSFESLKHVTTYDLCSQNKKKRFSDIKQAIRMVTKDDHVLESAFTNDARDSDLDTSSMSRAMKDEDDSGVPIEVRIRDKSSATYQKLVGMLEKQLTRAHNQGQEDCANMQQSSQAHQQINQEQKKQTGKVQHKHLEENIHEEYIQQAQTAEDSHDLEVHRVEQHKLKKERNVKSQGRHEKTPHNFGEILRHAKASTNNSGSHVKKNLSYDKVGGRGDPYITLATSAMDRTFGGVLNLSSSKGDTRVPIDFTKVPQESMKKLFNSNVLRSITPHSNKSQPHNNYKENVYRTYTQENYSSGERKSPMTTLYQKAKNEILNSKLKLSNPGRYHVKNSNTSMSATKRGDTPTDLRKVNFSNFYGSSDVISDKSSMVLAYSSQNNIAKKESVRAFHVGSPYKKPQDASLYASYDHTSQSKIVKKPSFKLDIQRKSPAFKDTLSSTRNRKKGTPDRYSDSFNPESIVRGSYDIHNGYLLNNSTQKNISKKHINFAQGLTTAKNLSFTNMFSSYK